ncbi:MAG: ribosomal protein [Bacteroidota bacterium]
MTKQEKTQLIEDLKVKFSGSTYFYIADSTSLTVEEVNKLRKLCFSKGIEMKVAKNSLIEKALEATGQASPELIGALKGQSSIFFSEVGNAAGKTLKEFRGAKGTKPSLKVAYIDSAIYIGDDQLDALSKLKSKHELIGEIIALLQSPAKNVIGALKSGGPNKIGGLVKALQERAQ